MKNACRVARRPRRALRRIGPPRRGQADGPAEARRRDGAARVHGRHLELRREDVPASPFGPEHATEGVAHAQMALGGFRLVIHYDEAKTAANPMPYHVLQVVGWDPAQKAFDSVCFDSSAGRARRPRPAGRGTPSSSKGPASWGVRRWARATPSRR